MPESTVIRTVLRSDEFTCPSCVRTVQRVLAARDGVQSSAVHVSTGRVEVHHDPSRVSVGDLVESIRAAGYDAAPAPF
jgi:copper chaperone